MSEELLPFEEAGSVPVHVPEDPHAGLEWGDSVTPSGSREAQGGEGRQPKAAAGGLTAGVQLAMELPDGVVADGGQTDGVVTDGAHLGGEKADVAQSVGRRSSVAQTVGTNPAIAMSSMAKSAGRQLAEAQPAGAQSAERQTSGAHPAVAQSAGMQPVDAQPAVARPAEVLPETRLLAERLVAQAETVCAMTGMRLEELYAAHPDGREKVLSGEWDFVDLWRQAEKHKPPAPVRSANGTPGGIPAVSRMSDRQFSELNRTLAHGGKVRF